jgi:SAM-dependent MidA family methyltransferase
LGLLHRLATLIRRAPQHAEALSAAYHRLTHPTQMGTLFQVMGVGGGRAFHLRGREVKL